MSAYGTALCNKSSKLVVHVQNQQQRCNSEQYKIRHTKKQENKESHDHLLNQVSQAWK